MENKVGLAIVDDEIDLVGTYNLLFRKRGIPVAFSVYEGKEAIKKFYKSDPRPGIVILDYRLPDMDGLSVMAEILTIEPRTKIVIISADESIKYESINNGAKAFFKKPISINTITETINYLVNCP